MDKRHFIIPRAGAILVLLFGIVISALGFPQPVQATAPVPGEPEPAPAVETGLPSAGQPRPLLAATPSLSLNIPPSVMLGSQFTFTATFDNTGADPGYGPFIDIVLPAAGVDGMTVGVLTPPSDGVSFVSASYLGAAIPAGQIIVQTFPDDDGAGPGATGCVQHPIAVRPANDPPLPGNTSVPRYYQICGGAGDELVTIILPFGSFVPTQPPASVTITAQMSNLADLGTALTIRGQSGFQFGETPINDFCCFPYDATIPVSPGGIYDSSTWPGSPVEPEIITISKDYVGPENETATGSNYPRQFEITVDIADGQTVGVAGDPTENLVITDTLPNNIQYISLDSSTPAGASCSEPSTSAPGGTLTCSFDSVTGGAGAADATLTFSFYVDRIDSGGGDVIDPLTGASANSDNTADATGTWDPIDTRDEGPPLPTATANCGVPCVGIQDQSIVVQKGVGNITDGSNSPGDVLEYTLNFQVSDFFGFEAIDLTDTFSDAQRFDDSFVPRIQINGNGGNDLATVAMDMNNVDIACRFSSGSYPAYCDSTPGVDAGQTTIVFNLSDELVTRSFNGQLLGGCVDPTAANNPPDCGSYNNGGTTGTITFRTVIQDQFTDGHLPSPPNSGDPSVDHGDILNNDVDIEGNVLDISVAPVGGVFTTTTGGTPTDDSGASVSIEFGGLDKRIFAVNGNTSLPEYISPGDVVTYRLTYTQPTSDFEDTTLTDYLPLPVFSATELGSGNMPEDTCTNLHGQNYPPAGSICLHANDTYHSLVDPNPKPSPMATFTTDAAGNSLTIVYDEYDSINNTSSVIDILFSLTVEADPFADGLFLTNQAASSEGTTNAGDQALTDIVQIKIGEPVLSIGKTAVSSDHQPDTDIIFTPLQTLMSQFAAPGGAGAPFSGTITSQDLSTDPAVENAAFDLFNATMEGVDGSDLVKYAIVIENRGHSANGAYDLAISDILPPGMIISGGSPGLNLQVYNGAGSAFGFEVIDFGGDGEYGTGDDSVLAGTPANAPLIFDPNHAIRVVDPAGPSAPGSCQVHSLTGGANVIIVTYDLLLPNGEPPASSIINTASLYGYGSVEGGENFLEEPINDDAEIITKLEPGYTKVLTSTDVDNANNGATDVVIGEILTYTLTTQFYELTYPNTRIVDTLDVGLAFVDLISVTNSNPTDLTSTVMTFDGTGACTNCVAGTTAGTNNPLVENNGGTVTFDFGNIANVNSNNLAQETITIVYRAVATNVVTSQAASTLSNSANLTWTTGSLTDDDNDVNVIEPDIATAKAANPTSVDAGNTVTYTVTLTNGNGATDTDAYDVTWSDTLPVGTTYFGGTLALGTCPNAPDTLSDAAAPTLTATWDGANAFPKNSSCEITFDVTVDYSVNPGETLTNTANTEWTSLPGDVNDVSTYDTESDERTGTDGVGGALNDYASTGDADVTITNPATVKYLITTSETHTSDNPSLDGSPGNERPVAIGEIIRYRLVTTIPEGTSPNFQISDRLPNGLIFLNDNTVELSFVSDNGILSTGIDIVPAIPAGCNVPGNTADATTPAGLTCSDDPAYPPATRLADENIASTMSTSTNTDTYVSGADVFFKLGNLINNDNDADAEYIVIELNAILHNSETHRNDAGEDKANSARAYINGVVNGSDSNAVEVNVVEPHLVIDKNIVTPANDAGDPLVYRISITNDADTFFSVSNAAPAFDLALSDSLDSNLNLQNITIYTAGENGSLTLPSSCGGTAQTVTDTSTLGVGGTASVDISCLNAGETLVVDVNTVVINTAPAGVTIPNAATITGTSLPGGDAGIYESDGNGTGSNVPGNPGEDNGERDGSDTDSGGKDDYYASDNVNNTLDMPAPVKSITATSEAHTDDTTADNSGDPRPLVIGEIMRYRLAIQLPEGTNNDFIVEDIIPAGLTFIDGTLELQYLADNNVTNVDATANTDLNGANSGAISLPAAYFSLVGQTLAIDLESPINNDINDGNTEYVILEFNVLVNNDATNQNTTVHDNDFTVEVNGNTPVASNTVYSEVLEPKLYVDKSTADPNWLYGETVTYTLQVGHVNDANTTLDSTEDAYDIVITDDIPTELTYVSADLSAAPGWTASFSDPTLTLSCLASSVCSLPLDNSVTIAFTATVNNPLPNMPPAPDSEYLDGSETATNTADMVWTSLPNEGTSGNPTGSDTPGASGAADGERNGNASGENDYNDNDSQDGQLNTYALGNRVWFDTDNDATIDVGTELGVAGVEVHLYNATTMTKIDTGPDGIPGTLDDGTGEVTTDANGYYLFDYLGAGDYVVVIPATELGTGGTLEGYYSSQTAMNGSGVITETAAPDPDNDTDSDDNGTLDISGGALDGAVVSLPVTLGPIAETEPTNDDDFANGSSEDSDQIDGRSNLSVDFGFYKTAIGNLVWLDENPDGAYVPADDILLNGVAVELLNGVTNAVIDSTTTNASGVYLFDNLPEGEYVIRVVAPAQTVSTRDDADQADNDAPDTNTDNNDNGDGTSAGTVASAVLTMDAGNSGAQTNNTVDDSTGTTTNPTMDFGFSYAYALGNRVWFDTNNDSSIDFGTEVGVNDVTVELYAADGSGNPTGAVLATDVTASDGTNDGYYLFDYLFPGDYVVVIPAGEFDSTSPLGGTLESYWSSATTLSSGGVLGETAAPDPDNDTDSDDNGTLDTSGGAFDGAVVSAAVTLGPGAISEPGGETDLEGGFDGDQPDTRANMTVDFGFYKTEIGNLVYGDVDKNGNYDSIATDTLYNGITVQLFNSDGTVEIGVGVDGVWGTGDDAAGGIQTDANGEYRFSGLPEGDYVVKVIAPSGTVSTIDTFDAADMANPNTNTDNNDNGQGESDGTVEANAVTMNPGVDGAKPNRTVTQTTGTTLDYTVDFGFTTIYALGNRVWFDTNNDSAISAGEVGVNGVTVQLYAADGSGNPTGGVLATDTTTTDGTNGGYYLFDYLESGDYVVVIPDTEFASGAVLEGYWSSATSRNADGSLTETAAPDADDDADSDDNGTLQTAGSFSGSVISSAVTLGPTPTEPVGETDVHGTDGQGSQPDDQANMTVDFGFYTMTLGDLVWNDVNTLNNGLFESGTEAGIDGVEIQLWTADLSTQLDSVTTAGGGIYSFTGLPQGDYFLRIPAAEFEGAQTLRDYATSTGALPLGYYEPAPDADVDLTDSDDNGTQTGGTTGLGGYIQSAAVTMTPTGEASYDNNTGTTVEPRVDFGVFSSPQADLAITKDDGTSYYLQGGTLTYTIVVSNNGPADVTGAVVDDAIPTQIASWDWTCTSSTGGASGCDPVAGSTTDFSDTINLPFNASITYTVTATIDTAATGILTNSVTVTTPGGVAETNITNNTDDDVDQPAILNITKDDGFTVVAPGSVLTYTIDITNNGAVALTDLTVTDTLPAEVDFQSAVPTPTTNVGGVLTWNHAGLGLTGPFAPGATTSISLTIRVKDNADIPGGVTSLTNNITVSDSVTGTTDDDDDTDVLARDNVKDLIASNHPPTIYPEVTIGEILTYRISIVVPAGVTMTNLRAVDVLESGLTFDECQNVSAPDLTSTRVGGIAAACPLGGSAANPDPAVTNSGHNVTMNFGDVTNNHATEDRTLSVDYWVVVLDTADNNNGVTGINNFVTWQWDGGSLAGFALPVEIVEPDLSILKDATPSIALVGSTITFTIDIEHTSFSTTNAYDVVVTDQLPTGLEYIGNVTTTGLAFDRYNYDTVTSTVTFEWDVFPLLAASSISFEATFVGPPPVVNEANVAWTSIPLDPGVQSNYNVNSTERFYDPLDLAGVNNYGVSSSVTINRPALPKTGFAPGRVTDLPAQPKEKEYQQIDALALEIPRLSVSLPIVGVPTSAQGWDLTWLSNQAGWLEGTAYPTLAGNSGLTAHTYLADGTPGPFVNLGSLTWGDQVYIHANGNKYTYEVREVRLLWPNDVSVLRHEEYDWITLITCRDYNEKKDDYTYRVAVRAILVKVEPK